MKLMHALWLDYQRRTYGGPLDPSTRQYREIRQAFYAGAIETMDAASRMLSDNDVATQADVDVLDALKDEANAFFAETPPERRH